MKKPLYVFCLFFVLAACSKEDSVRNPNLLDINFQFTLYMSLPQYSQLQNIASPIYVNGPGYGNKGIIIIKTGRDSFRAFDAADPNHPPSQCSILNIDDSIGTCGCNDENSYYLITGLPKTNGLKYGLLEYRVTNNGNGTLTVSN